MTIPLDKVRVEITCSICKSKCERLFDVRCSEPPHLHIRCARCAPNSCMCVFVELVVDGVSGGDS